MDAPARRAQASAQALRSKRQPGPAAGKRPIHERPRIVAERRRFADWEADTVHGKGRPCLATAVERKSGLVRLGPLRRPTVEHERALGATVYFATPHHAWERGTNENTNGLIRQYAPKGTSLAGLTQARCNDIAFALNHRPRRRLGFRTPHEVYYRSVLPPRR